MRWNYKIFSYIPEYNIIYHWCNNILTKEHFSKTQIQKNLPKCLECIKNYSCINEYRTLIKNIEKAKKIKKLNKSNKSNKKLKNHIKMLNKQQMNCWNLGRILNAVNKR